MWKDKGKKSISVALVLKRCGQLVASFSEDCKSTEIPSINSKCLHVSFFLPALHTNHHHHQYPTLWQRKRRRIWTLKQRNELLHPLLQIALDLQIDLLLHCSLLALLLVPNRHCFIVLLPL